MVLQTYLVSKGVEPDPDAVELRLLESLPVLAHAAGANLPCGTQKKTAKRGQTHNNTCARGLGR